MSDKPDPSRLKAVLLHRLSSSWYITMYCSHNKRIVIPAKAVLHSSRRHALNAFCVEDQHDASQASDLHLMLQGMHAVQELHSNCSTKPCHMYARDTGMQSAVGSKQHICEIRQCHQRKGSDSDKQSHGIRQW